LRLLGEYCQVVEIECLVGLDYETPLPKVAELVREFEQPGGVFALRTRLRLGESIGIGVRE